MLPTQYNDYREYLSDVLGKRRQDASGRYSLRSFAKDIGISPTLMSHVFSRKKGMSVDTAHKVADALGLSPDDAMYFCDLVQSEHGRTERFRRVARERLDRLNPQRHASQMHRDQYRSFAEWHHNAIVELTAVSDFKDDSQWIAKRLGLDPIKVSVAIERLLSVGLLERRDGKLQKPVKHVTTVNDVPHKALRQFHKEMLQRAHDAIEEQPLASREVATIFMTIKKEILGKVGN